jgi:hypothetical protein
MQLKPDQWYFVVNCAKCKEPIPFLEAPSPEEKPEVKQRQIAGLKCGSCGQTGTYAPALMYRAQGPEKKPTTSDGETASKTLPALSSKP